MGPTQFKCPLIKKLKVSLIITSTEKKRNTEQLNQKWVGLKLSFQMIE